MPASTDLLGNCVPAVKIKSSKSDIKLYKIPSNETTKSSPQLLLRGSSSQNTSNDMDKITQAWNKLKISTLSKAIAMAPYVGPCTLGPNSVSSSDLECDSVVSEASDCEKPDLRNAVTSTPMKPKRVEVKLSHTRLRLTDSASGDGINYNCDISEISRPSHENESSMREIRELEKFRIQTLRKIEAQIMRSAEIKKSDVLRKWAESDERIKVQLVELKEKLDRERLLQIQEQFLEAQKLIKENQANAEITAEELQQSKYEHEKKLAVTSEKIKQIEQMRKDLEEKQKLSREQLKQNISRVLELQVAYNQTYTQISEITRKCKDRPKLNELVTKELMELKEMNEVFLSLVEKGKDGKITAFDVKQAEFLMKQLNGIRETFFKHTEQVNQDFQKAEESKKKEELEKELKAKEEALKQEQLLQKAKEEQEKLEKENKKKSVTATKLQAGVEDCISGECLRWHGQLSRFLEDYERKLEPLFREESLKKFRFECQKAVNLPVNAISPLDDIHLEDKLYKLSRLLHGQAVPLNNSMFHVTGHPLGIPFCTNLLAKKFVKQGELTVSSKPEAAFAIAAVIVALWTQFPDFGTLLLAHFQRECPYLIPAFLPQVEGQSDEDYYKMLGYQYMEDGKVETQDKFLRRMSGIMRLYAAILITPVKRSLLAEGRRHPHSMRAAWRWLAAMLNLRPKLDISATLIFDFLEVTGRQFSQTYRTQFTKLLHFLCVDYFPLIEQVSPDDSRGPVVRLKNFLEKVLKENQVPAPVGILPPNFW